MWSRAMTSLKRKFGLMCYNRVDYKKLNCFFSGESMSWLSQKFSAWLPCNFTFCGIAAVIWCLYCICQLWPWPTVLKCAGVDFVSTIGLFYCAIHQSLAMPKTALQKLVAVPDALQASIARTRVSYRQLGRSGLRVSNPIMGGMHLGSSSWLPWVLDESKVS